MNETPLGEIAAGSAGCLRYPKSDDKAAHVSLDGEPSSWRCVIEAFVAYAATSCLIVMGAGLAGEVYSFGPQSQISRVYVPPRYLGSDGALYLMIAKDGYTYDPEEGSLVAFFPLYPMSVRAIVCATGLSYEAATLVVAHAYLAGAFVGLSFYARRRFGPRNSDVPACVLLALGLCPPTFFLRMAYSESCFLFFVVLAMLAMERHWPSLATALFVGAATAARAVGVCLVPVFAVYVWRNSPTRGGAVARLVLLLPLAASGLAAFMVYQHLAFNDAFAFAKTQQHFVTGSVVAPWEKTLSLLSLEPIWSVYRSDSAFYWQRVQPGTNAWLNLAFANPIYVLGGVTAVIVGFSKRWLTSYETLLAALLLFVPYLTQACETCMAAQGRYMAVAFPVYLVLGRLLAQLPRLYAGLLCGAAAFYLGAYAYLSAVGMPLL